MKNSKNNKSVWGVTWAEIDLDALAANVAAVKRHIDESVEIYAVVKANAYGHGAVQASRTALEAGATRLAVHRAIEGIELRKAGLEAQILLMGYTPPIDAEMVARWRLTPSVTTMDFAQAISSQACILGVNIPVHVKVDSGMSRYGLIPNDVVGFVRALGDMPGINVEGIFTHFSTADSADQTFVRQQLRVFNDVLVTLRSVGIEVPLVHAANSAAIMKLPESHFNAVRPGIILYGLDPSSEWPPVFEIRPVLTLKSIVIRVQDIPAGTAVGYGRTFIAKNLMRVALIPVGYGDGYHRILSNKGMVLVRGNYAHLLGRVSMDQIVVDVTDIQDVQQDDEVVLIGRQGQAQIRAEMLADLAGTINYEVTTSLLPRVTRIYKHGIEIVGITSLQDQ